MARVQPMNADGTTLPDIPGRSLSSPDKLPSNDPVVDSTMDSPAVVVVPTTADGHEATPTSHTTNKTNPTVMLAPLRSSFPPSSAAAAAGGGGGGGVLNNKKTASVAPEPLAPGSSTAGVATMSSAKPAAPSAPRASVPASIIAAIASTVKRGSVPTPGDSSGVSMAPAPPSILAVGSSSGRNDVYPRKQSEARTNTTEMSTVESRFSLFRKQSKMHTIRLMAKAAILVRAINLNKRDDIIDIYHDPKAGYSKYMIHPNSNFRRTWDYLTASLVVYVCTMVPLIIGFGFVDWERLSTFDTIIDVYFALDMVITLRTGIFCNGDVIMDGRVVAKRYFRTWFIIDAISNFPLALFVKSSAKKSVKIVKIQKIPKLLRFGRLLKNLKEYAKYYHFVLSVIGLIMGLHIFTCLWASIFSECKQVDNDDSCDFEVMGQMYIQSLQSVLVMFLGISDHTSFASLTPWLVSPTEKAGVDSYMTSIAIFLVGLLFSSFLFGNLLTLLMGWDQQSAMFRNRMDVISAEMKYYELPEDLQHRVRRNYDYLWINQRAYSDMMLLNQPGISKPLRTTIALHLYKDLVKTVPFFAGSDVRFLGKVCLALETAVYLPGDIIIFINDIGKEMFIVRKGLVEILIPDPDNPNGELAESKRETHVYLRDGNFFGETALVIDVRRTNTVRAVNICDLNVLNKSAFNEIVAEYPEFGERMKRTVIKRQLDNMNIKSPIEKARIQNQLQMVVEKSLKQRRMSVSLRAIYRAKRLGDKLKEIADRAAKANQSAGRRSSNRGSGLFNAARLAMAANKAGVSTGEASATTPVNLVLESAAQSAVSIPRKASGGASSSGKSSADAKQHSDADLDTTGDQVSSLPVLNDAPMGLLPGQKRARRRRSPSKAADAIPQIDAVSRKLSRAELTTDLIPMALLDISKMVNQIKRTTERLNRRLQSDYSSSSDEDEEDDEIEGDPRGSYGSVSVPGESESSASGRNSIDAVANALMGTRSAGASIDLPVVGNSSYGDDYDIEEEIARRESNSTLRLTREQANVVGKLMP